MTEGLADEYNRATDRLCRLYGTWSDGNSCGLIVTGNIMVDRRYMERPGNIAIDGAQDQVSRAALRKLAGAGTKNKCHFWAQLSHAGRQQSEALNLQGVGPSAVEHSTTVSALGIAKAPAVPRALSAEELKEIVGKFAAAALVCKETGFTGVQVHASHGFLLSSFLNPRANVRTDEYGGSLENRARLLLEVVSAVRKAVGSHFPVGVKLNSSDFQKGGFTHEEAVGVAKMLDSAKIDLLEISGGNYENLAIFGGEDWWEQGVVKGVKGSTVVREAYFLKYAKDIRAALSKTPLMVTGGMRSLKTMADALRSDCDALGIGRPLCGNPQCVADLLDGEEDTLPSFENSLQLPWYLKPCSGLKVMKAIKAAAPMRWCMRQLIEIGETGQPVPGLSAAWQIQWIDGWDNKMAAKLKGDGLESCRGKVLNAPKKGQKQTPLEPAEAAPQVYHV